MVPRRRLGQRLTFHVALPRVTMLRRSQHVQALLSLEHLMGHCRRRFGDDAVSHAARSARLSLPPDRRAPVADKLESIYSVIDELDDVLLLETPPATSFDPRWRP